MPQLITKRLIDDLVRAKKMTDIADVRQPGLVVRSGRKRVAFVFVWAHGGFKQRLTLGLVGELAIDDARDLARKAADVVSQGLVPDEDWVRGERNPEAPALVVKRKTWTFAEARTAFLKEVEKARKPATFDDYRKALNHKIFQPLERRAVSDITEEEVSEILAAYHREQKGKAAAGLKRRLSPFWTFMQRADNRQASGVRRKLQIDLPKTRYRPGKPKRFPHPSEVAELYAKAAAGELGWASTAVMLLCLTAQRRETIVTAAIDAVYDGIWHIPPVHRKTAEERQDNQVHALPWPKQLEAAGEPWLFPAKRPRYAGGSVEHMASSTVTHALADAGVGFSPHDIRRTFQTTMAIHEQDESALLILDHNEGPASTQKTHYNAYRDLPKKRKMLTLWQSYVVGKKTMSDDKWLKETGQRRSESD